MPEIDNDWIKKKYNGEIPNGDFVNRLLQSDPPSIELYKAKLAVCSNFWLGEEAYRNTKFRISGRMIYPPNGFMEWHTNGDWPGARLYASWSENGDSGMLFVDNNNKPYIDKDHPGWNIRSFECPTWHAVWSKCWRVSVGWHMGEKPIEVENLVSPTEQ